MEQPTRTTFHGGPIMLRFSLAAAFLLSAATAFAQSVYSDFPAIVMLEGVTGPVETEVSQVGFVTGRGVYEGAPEYESILTRFHASIPDESRRVALFEVKGDQKFWLGSSSSMGTRSLERMVGLMASNLTPERADRCGSMTKEESLLSHLFEGANATELAVGTGGLASLVTGLVSEGGESVRIERPVYVMGCVLDSFTYQTFSVFFVDPTPFRGPDENSYVVLVDSTVTE